MSGIEIHVDGLIPANRKLKSLALNGVKKRRELTKLCRKVISNSKKRVRYQEDLNEASYKKRAKPRKDRRKMLSRLVKMLKVMRNDGTDAQISFPGFAANIAAKQQYGFTETATAKPMTASQRQGTPTRKQAKALRDLGFKVGGKKVSLKYIQANLKSGKVGALIKALRIKQGLSARTSWQTTVVGRSFLGATTTEIEELTTILINDITEEI